MDNVELSIVEEYSTPKSKTLEFKALLLLQFQPQLQIAIMLSTYFAYSCSLIDFAMIYGADLSNNELKYTPTGLSTYILHRKAQPLTFYFAAFIFSCDILYLIDIVLMMSYKSIQWRELEHVYDKRSTFLIILDIISVIPWDALYVSLDEVSLRTVYVLRLRYALRIFRFLIKTKNMKETEDAHKIFMEIFYCVIIYTLVLTTLSCITYIIMCQTTNCPYHKLGLLVKAFYIINEWLAFQATELHTELGMLFSIWLISINVSSFLYFLGGITSRLILIKIQNYRREQMFNSIRSYALNSLFAGQSIDWSLVRTCKTYFSLLWNRRQGIIFDNMNVKEIPAGMVKEIDLDLSWDPLKHSHLFRDQKVEFLRLISPYLKHSLLLPGEVIFRRNQRKSQMVYIFSGTVQILSEQDGETPILSLSGGSCIGESTLVIDYPASYSVICQSACEVSILKRKDFLKTYLKYPYMYKAFLRKIQNRYLNTKKYYNAMSRLWDKSEKEKEALILKWLKDTLQELMLRKNMSTDHFEALSLYANDAEDNVIFCTKYLDLLAITKKTALVTDTMFLKNTCPCIFQPDSFIVSVWNKFIEITAFILMIVYPYYASFEPNTPVWYYIFLYMTLMLWILDVYVAFSTAIKDQMQFCTTMKEIALVRIQNPLFMMDLIATIPLELIAFIIDDDIGHQNMILLQSLRLLKCYKIDYIFRNSKVSVIPLTYIKFVVYLLLLIYYETALLYLNSCYNFSCSPDDPFWKHAKSITDNPKHIIVIYASFLAQETANTGLVVMFDGDEVLYLVQMIKNILPFIFYVCFISSTTAMETLTRCSQLKGQIFAKDIMVMMKTLNIKLNLQNIVICHIQNQLEQTYGINYKPYKIIEYKYHPIILQNLNMLKYGSVLESLKLFQDLPKTIIPEIAGICHSLILEPNEVVTLSGEADTEIYVLLEGYCKIASSMEISKPIIKHGYVLSALEMFLDIPVAQTVITLTHSELIVIPCSEFMKILIKYPKILSEFQTTAHQISENDFFDWGKENCDYSLGSVNTDKAPSFKHFGYYLSSVTKEGIDYHKLFDELDTFGFVRYILLRHTIKTDGLFLKYWEISRCVFAFVTALLTPIIPISSCTHCFWYYLLLLLDITAWIDIYVKHHICYFNKQNIEVTHPLKTAIHYWQNSFLVDLLGALPLDGIIIYVLDIEDNTNNRCFIKMIKLLQTYRIIRGIAYINKNLIFLPHAWNVLQYLPTIILFINTMGSLKINTQCKFDASIQSSEHFTSGVFCQPDIWLSQPLYQKPISPLRLYLYGVFYVLIFTIGPALSNIRLKMDELVQAMFMGIIGYVYMVHISAKIVTSSIYRRSGSVLQQRTMSSLITFLSCKRLDVVLKQEIFAHFDYLFKIRQRKNLQKLLKEKIRVTLQAEILFEVFGDTMKHSTVFSNTTDSFLKNLLVCMNHEVILNRGIICKINDIHNKIYFVVEGEVNVLGADYNQLVLLGKGSLFGSLDNDNFTRQRLTMVAKGHVELLSITNIKFHNILRHYVHIKFEFRKLTIFNSDYILESPMETLKEDSSNEIPQASALMQIVKKFTQWENLVIACLCYIGYFVEIYLITMQDHTTAEIAFAYLCDALYILYIYFNFYLQYSNKYGIVVTDKKKIASRCMKKRLGFYLDLVSVIPFEIISLFFIQHGTALRVWNFCRANRLLRIFTLIKYLNKIGSQVYATEIVAAVILGVWISLIIQLATSVIIMTSCLTPQFNLNPLLDCNWSNSTYKLNVYIDIYSSVASIFTGTALMKSPNSPELIFAFIVLLLGLKFLSIVVIKEIVAVLHLLLINKRQYEIITYELKQYMSWRHTSPALVNRVHMYINYLWKHKRGHQMPRLLEEAPYYLREAVLNSIYGYLLRKHRVFSSCHVDLIRQISSKLRPVVFLYGDYIAFKNDVDECMYFVHEGSVDAISKESANSEKIVNTINPGEAFGYKAGLFPRYAHHFTYRANQLTVVIVLKREDWIYLLDFFPASKYLMLKQ